MIHQYELQILVTFRGAGSTKELARSIICIEFRKL